MDHVQLRTILTKLFPMKNTTPLFIWGAMGMGRTAIPNYVAKDLGYNFCTFSMAEICDSRQIMKKYKDCIKDPNAKTIIVVDELTRTNHKTHLMAIELILENCIDGCKLENVLVLAADYKMKEFPSSGEKAFIDRFINLVLTRESEKESSFHQFMIDLKLSDEPLCGCGAKHGSTPNYHQDYCRLYKK